MSSASGQTSSQSYSYGATVKGQTGTEAGNRKRYFKVSCALDKNALNVAVNPIDSSFVFTNHGVRGLYENFSMKEPPDFLDDTAVKAIIPRQALGSEDISTWLVAQARQCVCDSNNSPKMFCLAPATFCSVPYRKLCLQFSSHYTVCADPISDFVCLLANLSDILVPICYVEDTALKFARTSWNFIFMIYFSIFVLLLCTTYGRAFFDYIITSCWPEWNNIVVRRIQQFDPKRTKLLLQRASRRRRQELAARDGQNNEPSTEEHMDVLTQQEHNVERRYPTSLALKTRAFHGEEYGDQSDDNGGDFDNVCCICFAEILHGDIVGDLPCSHMFHKECIKDWIKRRNACPLCLTTNIALPRYGEVVVDRTLEDSEASEINEPAGPDP
jgi:hypothetical protein